MNYNIYVYSVLHAYDQPSSNNASSQFQTVNPNPTHEYASGNGQYVNQPIQSSNQKLQPIPTTVGNAQPYVSQQVPTGQQYYPMSYEQPSNPQQTMQYNFVNMGLNHGLNDPNMMAMMNMNRNMDMYVTLLSRYFLHFC